jgi:hypothetical protein
LPSAVRPLRAPWRGRLLLCLLAALALAGLPHRRAVAQSTPSGRISFLHLSADAPALDIYVDGGRAVTGLGFGEASEYLGLAPGGHQVQITPSGRLDQLLSDTARIDAGSSYTWVIAGIVSSADVSIPLTPDLQIGRHVQLNDNAGSSGNGLPRLRIVNASPGSGNLDVRTDGDGGVALATGLSYGNASDYTALQPGAYTVNVFAAGGQSPLASIGALAVQGQNAYTLVLGGLLPSVIAPNPPVPVQSFTSVRLTDQNTLRSAPLTRGCNQVIFNLPAGTPIINLLPRVADPSAVMSIWRFDNSLKSLRAGYFSDPAAPVDYTTTSGGPEASFICVSSNTSWNPTS